MKEVKRTDLDAWAELLDIICLNSQRYRVRCTKKLRKSIHRLRMFSHASALTGWHVTRGVAVLIFRVSRANTSMQDFSIAWDLKKILSSQIRTWRNQGFSTVSPPSVLRVALPQRATFRWKVHTSNILSHIKCFERFIWGGVVCCVLTDLHL